jgi:hypothetical protein
VIQNVSNNTGYVASLFEVLREGRAAEIEVAVSGAEVFVWLGRVRKRTGKRKGNIRGCVHCVAEKGDGR